MSLKISLSNAKIPVSHPNPWKRGSSAVSLASRWSGGARRPFRTSAAAVSAYSAGPCCKESLYQLLGLGVEESVSGMDIKKAYKQMVRKYHPDVAPPDRVDEHARRFIMVKEAYDTLSNPQKRALYDRDLARSGRRPHRHYDNLESEEKEEWRMRWEAQLEGLKQRSNNPSSRGRVSWAARMSNKTL